MKQLPLDGSPIKPYFPPLLPDQSEEIKVMGKLVNKIV